MSSKFSKILEPIKIGRVEIKNRVAMAPMGITGLSTLEGCFSQRAVDYYLERAKGGTGLIITGVIRVENEIEKLQMGTFRCITMYPRHFIATVGELTEAVHAHGSKIFIQLSAGYGRIVGPAILACHPVAPSAIPNYWDPTITCRELTTEEVERLVKRFDEAAEIAVAAGFDGIEVHAMHGGYLLDQFAIAMFNRRTDKYGGDLRGRLTFPIEILHRIKNKVGKDFPVMLRFSIKSFMKDWNQGGLPGEEFEEKGRDIEEGLEVAKILKEAGYDAFDADAGSYEARYWTHPPVYQEYGCYLPLTEKLKKVVKIPVIVAGRMDVPEFAEKTIEEGKAADMVALGRGLLADPYWVKKIEEDRPEHIRPCIGCHNGCLGRTRMGKPLSCAVNPSAGRERAYRIELTNGPKEVMVVGGGVSGLEAARAATLRGHKVTLYEKSNALGGHLIEGAVPDFKKDLERLLNWYKVELKSLKVDIKLGTEVTRELIEKKKTDVVIVATGSKHIIPDVPGIDKDKVATATDVLLGKKKTGEEIVVIGGGLVGCETALWLAQQGKKVTIVEMLGDLMMADPPVPYPERIMLLDLLKLNKVEAITNESLLEVTGEGVTLISNTFKKETLGADTVVLSIGLKPSSELYNTLAGNFPNLYLIGDAREARNIMGSIWDAYEVARTI